MACALFVILGGGFVVGVHGAQRGERTVLEVDAQVELGVSLPVPHDHGDGALGQSALGAFQSARVATGFERA